MPPLPTPEWPSNKQLLAAKGVIRVTDFCGRNDIPLPMINDVPRKDWHVNSCAYYRPDTGATRKWTTPGISVCVELCASPCTEGQARAWSWPGSVTDRTPFGVFAHELGHHCDWLAGERKGTYYSEYCEEVKRDSGEPGLTSYADENPAEWFAESMRLFVTNSDLLRLLRPKAYAILLSRWKPVETQPWDRVLGANVPPKILRTLRNKGAR